MLLPLVFAVSSCSVAQALQRPSPQTASVRTYLEIDGKETQSPSVRLTRSAKQLTVELTAPRDGRYRFGLAIQSGEVRPLAPGLPSCVAASLARPLVLRYPYDWTRHGQGNVLASNQRLIMPGVMVDGALYLADTHELTSVVLERTGNGSVRTLLLKHRFYNDGGDAATSGIPLRAGQHARLVVLVFPDVRAANRARFGTVPAMQGRMTQIAYRGWTAIGLTAKQYDQIAGRLRGTFDYVITREAELRPWLPAIFHRHGLRVFAYYYLGALRRASPQVTPDIERDPGLHAADGSLYTAPRSPNGSWLLCDLRRPEVRQRLVDQARAAIEAGFDGVFLDGYPFWDDATGRSGGAAPGAAESLAFARWQFLHESREAIHTANPKACLGILGNHYYDSLGEADYVVKESMYFMWDNFAQRLDERATRLCQTRDVDYEEGQAPLAAKNIVYGAKGYSPLAVQTCFGFLRHPTGLTYCEPGDFYPDKSNAWLDTLLAIARYQGPVIRKIEPAGAWIRVEGRATISADTSCAVQFSAPVKIKSDAGAGVGSEVTRLAMEPKIRYLIGPTITAP